MSLGDNTEQLVDLGDNIELEVTDLGESTQDRGEGLPPSSPPL